MENPAAFLIAVWVQQFHVVRFYGGVDDGCEAAFFEVDDLLAIGDEAGFEGVGAVFIFEIAKGHIGGETFA